MARGLIGKVQRTSIPRGTEESRLRADEVTWSDLEECIRARFGEDDKEVWDLYVGWCEVMGMGGSSLEGRLVELESDGATKRYRVEFLGEGGSAVCEVVGGGDGERVLLTAEELKRVEVVLDEPVSGV